MHDEHQIPIWFFIGGLLTIYGVLITGAGLFALVVPPPEESKVALYYLHSDIWWGGFMTVVGLFYCTRYNPFAKLSNSIGRQSKEDVRLSARAAMFRAGITARIASTQSFD